MRLRLALVPALMIGAAAAAPPPPVTAVLTEGRGVLTKCYSWFVNPTCNIYHHIKLPKRIAVGDTVPVTYGSNPKYYRFSVLNITVHSDRCTIFGEQQGSPDRVDTLAVRPCRPAPPQ